MGGCLRAFLPVWGRGGGRPREQGSLRSLQRGRPPQTLRCRCSEGPLAGGVWHRHGPGRGIRVRHGRTLLPAGERARLGDPTGLPGQQRRPAPVSSRLRCRRTLLTRTLRPSAASCALWPPTATEVPGQGRPPAPALHLPGGAALRRGACAEGRGPAPVQLTPGTAAEPGSWPLSPAGRRV